MGTWSKNFDLSEVACKGENCCGHSTPMNTILRDSLQLLRDVMNMPIIITSGFRCNKHNAETPGAKTNSYHTKGLAVDIKCADMERLYFFAKKLFSYVKKYYDKNGKIIRLHVDLRILQTKLKI